MSVKDLMSKKVVSIYGSETVQRAAEIMAENDKGLLVVLDSKDHKIVGVISNKDIVNEIISKKKNPEDILVEKIMTKKVISVSPNEKASEAIQLMRKHGLKRIIVSENSELHGIVSYNDINKEMLKRKKQLLDLAIDF